MPNYISGTVLQQSAQSVKGLIPGSLSVCVCMCGTYIHTYFLEHCVVCACVLQRTAPKAFQQQMENLQKKIEARRDALADLERELKVAKREAKSGDSKAEK